MNGRSFPNCYEPAANSAGNTQVATPQGTYGEVYNDLKVGVHAVQWIPKTSINVWFFPRQQFSDAELKKDGWPLSNSPDPSLWPISLLHAAYTLDDSNALNQGCDLNFQQIIINITIGGGWGGGDAPDSCSVNYKTFRQDPANYLSKCFTETPENKGGVCNDGAFNETVAIASNRVDLRGRPRKPVFYTEAYFKFRSIAVFEAPWDDHVW